MKAYLLICLLMLSIIPIAEAQSFDPTRVSSVDVWYKESETLDIVAPLNYLNVSLFHYPKDYDLKDFTVTPSYTLQDGYLSFYKEDVSAGIWKVSLEGPIHSETNFPKLYIFKCQIS